MVNFLEWGENAFRGVKISKDTGYESGITNYPRYSWTEYKTIKSLQEKTPVLPSEYLNHLKNLLVQTKNPKLLTVEHAKKTGTSFLGNKQRNALAVQGISREIKFIEMIKK